MALHLPLHRLGQLLLAHLRHLDDADDERLLTADRADHTLLAHPGANKQLLDGGGECLWIGDDTLLDAVRGGGDHTESGDAGAPTTHAHFRHLDGGVADI